jgi:polyisoprenoid-binding protein YceI
LDNRTEVNQEDGMAPSGQMTAPELQALLQDATLAGNWTLDASKSTVGLKSKSIWGLVPVKGVFHDVTGSGTVSPAGEVNGTVSVAAASIDTKNKKRDVHLRSGDFFLSEKFPKITFGVEKVVPDGEGVTVSGTLTVRDRSREISFPATASLAADGEIALDATLEVDRSEFGLTWNSMGMASMKNTIAIHAVFTKD